MFACHVFKSMKALLLIANLGDQYHNFMKKEREKEVMVTEEEI